MRVAQRSLAALALALLLGAGCSSNVVRLDPGEYGRRIREAYRAYRRADYDLAFQRFSYTARLGDKGSQYTLGLLYLRGQGTEQDLVRGTAWLTVASEIGREDWLQASSELFSALDREQQVAVADLTLQLTDRYGMNAQGIVCRSEKPVGSIIPRTVCRKQPGRYLNEGPPAQEID